MNRRELFKRTAKLGAGLGLAAVVGVTAHEEEDELLTMARESLAELEAGERGIPWRELRGDPVYGYSQVTYTDATNDTPQIFYPMDVEAYPITEATTLHMTDTYEWGVRQGGAL